MVRGSGLTPPALFLFPASAVLEENIWGVPVSAMPVVVTAVVITALVFVAVPFWARRGLPAVVGWLNSDGGGSGVKARRG